MPVKLHGNILTKRTKLHRSATVRCTLHHIFYDFCSLIKSYVLRLIFKLYFNSYNQIQCISMLVASIIIYDFDETCIRRLYPILERVDEMQK